MPTRVSPSGRQEARTASPAVRRAARSQFAAARRHPFRRFVAAEWLIGARMAREQRTAAVYEFIRIAMKVAWACLFGAIMVVLLLSTYLFYPSDAALPRYDFLVLAAIAIQIALLYFRLETPAEAAVILVYHITGTVMEIFKVSVGSWIYPELSFLRFFGVPLFTGFMYGAIGSFIFRCWRLFEFKFTKHPPLWTLALLSIGNYINFFTHHYVYDMRYVLFAAIALLFWRTQLHFRPWKKWRSIPLLLGFILVATFIWFAENIGTFSRVWVYPSQMEAWHFVGLPKLGSWFLLMIISYTLVAAFNRPAPWGKAADR